MRTSIDGRVLVVVTLLGAAFSMPASGFVTPIGFFPPPPSPCTPPFLPITQVAVTATPNAGDVAPDVVVAPNTVVTLSGVAVTYQLHPNCSVSQKPATPFHWSLTFQPTGGVPGKASVALGGTGSLQPTLSVGGQAGRYVVTLAAGGKQASVGIEVLSGAGRHWVSIGPDGSGALETGRINALAFDPTRPSTLWAAGALGGAWRSPDRGVTWWPMTDHKGLGTLAASTIAVGSDGTVWVGTGDINGPTGGTGLFRSADGGVNWLPVATNSGGNCNGYAGTVNKLVLDPRNAARVYIATPSGLVLRSDGGCWTTVLSQAGNNITDLALDPSDSTNLWVGAAPFGIILVRSADSASPIASAGPNVPSSPSGQPWQRVTLAFAPSQPNTAYAAFSLDPAKGSGVNLIARSTDHLATLKTVTPNACPIPYPPNAVAGQCVYNNALIVSPTDPNTVFFAGLQPLRSTDGGVSFWQWIAGPHDDHHGFAFAPDDPNTLFEASDGGVYRARLSAGTGWEPRLDGLVVGEVYTLASQPANPGAAAIGLQDTGTARRAAGRTWVNVGDFDGSGVSYDADPTETLYYYFNAGTNNAAMRARSPAFSGTKIDGMQGFLASPYLPGELLGFNINGQVANRLFIAESVNSIAGQPSGPPTWLCVDPAPATGGYNMEFTQFNGTNYYYSGTPAGVVFRFTLSSPPTNGDCASATGAQNAVQLYSQPQGNIVYPTVDPFNPEALWLLTQGGSGANRIVQVSQNGQTVRNLGGNLPAVQLVGTPLVADPGDANVLYVGTSQGLLVGTADGKGDYAWALDPDVPEAAVNSLSAHRSASGWSGVVRVGTFGRGVWELVRPRPPCSKSSCVSPGAATAQCLTCPPATGVSSSAATAAAAASSSAAFAVPFTYGGEQGPTAVLRLTVLAGGAPTPYFATEAARVSAGDDTAVLAVLYGGAEAPLGLHSDAIRFELVSEDKGGPGTVLADATVPFDRWWIRPDARLVAIEAQTLRVGRSTVTAPIHIQVAGGGPAVDTTTPFAVAVPTGAQVRVTAPSQIEPDGAPLLLDSWADNGVLLAGGTQAVFTARTNSALVALYRSPEVRPPPPPFIFTAIRIPGAIDSEAVGINDGGDIVGDFIDGNGAHGFLLSGASLSTIDYPGARQSGAGGINDAGQIVGSYLDNALVNHGFLLDKGTFSTIDVPTAVQTFAQSINVRGEIAGSYFDGSSVRHGFVLRSGSFITIDEGGATGTIASGINDDDVVAGAFFDGTNASHGFVLRNGNSQTIDFPGAASTTLFGINDALAVSGHYVDLAGAQHGFLLQQGTFTNADVPGATGTALGGLNMSGQFVGALFQRDGSYQAFEATR